MGPASALTPACQRSPGPCLREREMGPEHQPLAAGACWTGVTLAHPLGLWERELRLQPGREGRVEDLSSPCTQSLSCSNPTKRAEAGLGANFNLGACGYCPVGSIHPALTAGAPEEQEATQGSPSDAHHPPASAPSICLFVFLWHGAGPLPGPPRRVSAPSRPVIPSPATRVTFPLNSSFVAFPRAGACSGSRLPLN